MDPDFALLLMAALLFMCGFMLALWSAHRQLGLDAWREGVNDSLKRQEERIESTVGQWRASRYNRDGTPKKGQEIDLNDPQAARAEIRRRASH